jgi:hypothetical protein
MMRDRRDYQIYLKDSLSQKPLHATEGSSLGDIYIPSDTSWHHTFANYNNYDVTFHNELWASAFMGGFTTLNTWWGEEVHRWKYATREDLGDVEQMNNIDSLGTIITISETIQSFYHNYRRLSEFISNGNIDFNQILLPREYFGDTTDYIESYYLLSTDSITAFGWIHNINKYWANSFYWSNSDTIIENYFGCYELPLPKTFFNLEGFIPNHHYYIHFSPTRMGTQVLPEMNDTYSDSLGNLLVDLSTAPLGCDSVNADYAFWVTDLFHARRSKPIDDLLSGNKFNLFVSPNPSSGIFRVAISMNDELQNSSLEVVDMTGRIIFKKTPVEANQFRLNLTNYAKGIYYLRVNLNNNFMFKKIVVY